MFNWKRLHKNEQGQAALETAIILIAFVVVAAVFAFTILSAGNSSTEKGKQAIAAGLSNVQSSMSIKGSVIAQQDSSSKISVVFTVALVAGGTPVDLSDTSPLVITYRDSSQFVNAVKWTKAFVGTNNSDDMLDAGETAEITVSLADLTTAPTAGAQFTLQVKPPTGAVLDITRTLPPALSAVMDLG